MSYTLNNLIRLINESGYSQRELAEKMEVSEACISRWVHKNRPNPSIGTVEKMADALGYKVCLMTKSEGDQ